MTAAACVAPGGRAGRSAGVSGHRAEPDVGAGLPASAASTGGCRKRVGQVRRSFPPRSPLRVRWWFDTADEYASGSVRPGTAAVRGRIGVAGQVVRGDRRHAERGGVEVGGEDNAKWTTAGTRPPGMLFRSCATAESSPRSLGGLGALPPAGGLVEGIAGEGAEEEHDAGATSGDETGDRPADGASLGDARDDCHARQVGRPQPSVRADGPYEALAGRFFRTSGRVPARHGKRRATGAASGCARAGASR